MFFNSDNILTELKNNPLCARHPLVGWLKQRGDMQAKQSTKTAPHGKPPVRVVYKGVLPCGAAVGAETSEGERPRIARCAGDAARAVLSFLSIFRLSMAALPFISTIDKLDYPRKSKIASAD